MTQDGGTGQMAISAILLGGSSFLLVCDVVPPSKDPKRGSKLPFSARQDQGSLSLSGF